MSYVSQLVISTGAISLTELIYVMASVTLTLFTVPRCQSVRLDNLADISRYKRKLKDHQPMKLKDHQPRLPPFLLNSSVYRDIGITLSILKMQRTV